MELNRIISQINHKGYQFQTTEIILDNRFSKLMNPNIRIVVYWDQDMSDIELIVTEPNGEKAYSMNNLTKIGGVVSRNFTSGHGPQEYLVTLPIYIPIC